ncbi:hypothetical protein GTA51_16945 [Desulfovibrio aerotolerans]|uniref:ApeI dehydratase-like domain-containing protein n=1 Tax=Solidesulfovibrio aerotolerans TaxID=295255 RepID=A0A7C9IWG9_9BACT|nr:hypothetical protein [Solidesulfovibrio aerotolerans]MYL84803.1 hypothetical protein [Solidesulfovibrio aerotolerans]
MSELNKAILAASRGDARMERDGWVCREFVFREDFPGFDGHFPNYPVLPAIIQMMAGASLTASWLGRIPEVCQVKNAKFMAPIHPNAVVHIHARAQGLETAEIRVLLGDRLAATFTLGFSLAV